MYEMPEKVEEKVEEKVFENKHIREKAGYAARKKRGEAIKEEMEDERVFRALKREQGERSGRAEPEFGFLHIFC
ncbi:unnamed protein product [marine sediment metagenome]|uniref:Uncharacterized protein n=1 Tax=marine sediment metagenome TaxID=412755 RepID=X0XE64_9ZZZZ